MPRFLGMKFLAITAAGLSFAVLFSPPMCAQTPAQSSDAAQIEALAKKVDEQSAKIDTLSQQILKLQQQLANVRPGVMIGEGAPSPAASPSPAEMARPANSSTHIVTRGETLTSIAKMYKVGVDELQKFNHIEDGRKLQAGQTVFIPTSPTPAASPSAK